MSLSRDLLFLSKDSRTKGKVEPFLKQRGYGLYSVDAQGEAVRKLRTKSVLGLLCDLEGVDDEEKLAEILRTLLAPGRDRFAVILIAPDLSEDTKKKFKHIPGVRALLSKPVDLSQLGRVLGDVAPLSATEDGKSIEFDDDDEKPINDPRDRVSIEVGLYLTTGGGEEKNYTMIEYGGGTLLFDGAGGSFSEGEAVRGRIVVSGPKGREEHSFESRIMGVEKAEDGSMTVTCDSSRIMPEALERLGRMLAERQREGAAFLASMKE